MKQLFQDRGRSVPEVAACTSYKLLLQNSSFCLPSAHIWHAFTDQHAWQVTQFVINYCHCNLFFPDEKFVLVVYLQDEAAAIYSSSGPESLLAWLDGLGQL